MVMRVARTDWRRASMVAVLACVSWAAVVARAEAQLGSLVSPGRLSRPHAALEGLANCTTCHEQGRKVTAGKCLSCHKPIADRIARKAGVHRAAAGGCVTCHVEHAGEDGELRPFDTRSFDHAGIAGFALDGLHARLATSCAACHKTRSFLAVQPACASCHVDAHKGALGQNCASCHSTLVAFKQAPGFDHAKSRFPLTGAHQAVACAKCHVNRMFRGLKFAACSDCHRNPHTTPLGGACAACHATGTWRTSRIDHRRTAFPLLGRHANVECAACHRQPAMKVKPRADTCAACHADVHRGTFRQDCKACHSENGFAKAPFDHGTTAFPLSGRHAAIPCSSCHKVVGSAAAPAARPAADFRGLSAACASCHTDVHRGELGTRCDSCHSSSGFKVPGYVHPRFPEFFSGQHAAVTCDKCHTRQPVSFKNVTTACTSCHRDVHLGQVGAACESCHSVAAAKFAPSGFGHDRTAFALTGRHQAVACSRCHKPETGTFPAGSGTAVRYKGVASACRACHTDVHLGQLEQRCETCHTTASFALTGYAHRGAWVAAFFTGRHRGPRCEACHKTVTGQFSASRGTAVQFKVGTRCVACHTDVHRGALGPDCGNCHRP